MERSNRVVLVGEAAQLSGPATALSEAEFDIRPVGNISELDSVLETDVVECVVSAFQVPRTDGLEFLGGLHALETVANHDPDVPRILYTDIVNPDIAREAVSLGLFDYIPANTESSLDRLVTRVQEATANRRAERRVNELARVNEVIREGLSAVIRAQSHEAVADEVTATLVATAAYETAWFGRFTDTGLERHAVAGPIDEAALARRIADGTPDERTVIEPGDGDGGLARRSVVVPISEDGLMLVLFTDRPEAFTGTEQRVLEQLGEAIRYSLDAISTREKLKEREAALAEKTDRLAAFASAVGHDLRNPLSVASGNLELAQSGDLDRLEEVDAALERMSEMIDDVLALAREGERSITLESTAVDDVVTEAWAAVETGAATLAGPDETIIRADRGQLRRLFENLFRNAVEHGGSDVAVSVEATAAGFAVADDGPGIDIATGESAFDLGVSGADSGTGLGLAIVENIAAAHGWSVSVGESAAGGARFEITGVESEA